MVIRVGVAPLGDLRSADLGDLSAVRGALGGVPWAAFALGTAGLRGLSPLGVGGVSPLGVGGVPFPLLLASGLALGLLLTFPSGLPSPLASARPDLLIRKSKKPPSDQELGSSIPNHQDPNQIYAPGNQASMLPRTTVPIPTHHSKKKNADKRIIAECTERRRITHLLLAPSIVDSLPPPPLLRLLPGAPTATPTL